MHCLNNNILHRRIKITNACGNYKSCIDRNLHYYKRELKYLPLIETQLTTQSLLRDSHTGLNSATLHSLHFSWLSNDTTCLINYFWLDLQYYSLESESRWCILLDKLYIQQSNTSVGEQSRVSSWIAESKLYYYPSHIYR